jgi:protein-S-isoprenylcysteine O-methyltransferase Ste14
MQPNNTKSKDVAAGSRLRLYLARGLAVFVLSTFAVGSTYWAIAHPVVEKSLYIMGIAAAGFGAAGRAWATFYIAGRKLKQLVTHGPYSMCRNPLYFFSMVLGIGLGLCTETLSAPLLVGLVLSLLYFLQIRREERLLLQRFGREYESYREAVPCFLPSYRNYCEAEQIQISPRLLKKGLFGTAFLLILIGAIELLKALHVSGLLPVLFHVY